MKFKNLFTLFLMCCFSPFTGIAQGVNNSNPPKLSTDEILAKHLSSIGSVTALASARSRVLVGLGTMTSRVNYAGKMGGMAQFAAVDNNVLLAMKLNSNDYPFEKFAFDGKNITVGRATGSRSILGTFLSSHSSALKKGVFGGVYRPSWLTTLKKEGFTVENAGLGTEDGRDVHKLRLIGGGLGELRVSISFDAETFRHIKTEYSFLSSQLTAPNPNRPTSIGSAPIRQTVIETFSNFNKAGELVLPLTYSIQYQGGDTSLVWTINFTEVYYDEKLEASAFKVA